MYFCRNFLLISAVILSQNVFSSDSGEIDWKTRAESYQQQLQVVKAEAEAKAQEAEDKFVELVIGAINGLRGVTRSNHSPQLLWNGETDILSYICAYAKFRYGDQETDAAARAGFYKKIYDKLYDDVKNAVYGKIEDPTTASVWENLLIE